MLTVLLVDDEGSIRSLLQRWVEHLGCRAMLAASAEAALALLEDHAEVAVALCDLRMPGLDGFWLVDQVRERFPKGRGSSWPQERTSS